MAWTFSNEVDEYEAAAGSLLRADAGRNTIGVTVIDLAQRRSEPMDPPELFAWWTEPHLGVTGCASITPPWPLLLESVPEHALRPLAERLRNDGINVPGVNGPTELAATFSVIWRSLSGERVQLHDAMRLFQLGTLQPPGRPVSGNPRLATDDDFSLVVDWYKQFGVEVHGPMPRVEENVRLRLEHQGVWLWCESDGSPVSLVARTPAIARVARIGPVFTPRESRTNGYAEALTHEVSRRIVAEGCEAVLFTEQSNQTSNGIYIRLGYRPVMDRAMLTFEPAPS